jgi:cytosine/adenosine deaminase-related metal-dependent hydrolase
MHVLETRYQREYARRRWGKSVVRHLDDLGALGPWLTVAHMVWVDPDDLGLLAERGVGIVHNPSSNLRLRSGIAPVAAMRGAGIAVGVGLDGHALDDDQDFLRELRLAWTLANRPGATSPSVSAKDVWVMGTTAGAAITFGPAGRLGSLREGSLADLVLLDRGAGLDDWTLGLAAQPTTAAESALLAETMLRGVSRRHVRDVMVNGVWAIRDGCSELLDEAQIVAGLRANLAEQRGVERAGAAELVRTLAPAIRAFYASWDANEGDDRE